MTTQTTQIGDTLGREFKHYVLAALRQAQGWTAYCQTKNWKGRTNTLTKDEINQACVDLNLDKQALWTTFKNSPSAANAAAQAAGAIIEGEGDEIEGDMRDMANEAGEDAAIINAASKAQSNAANAFEGKDAKAIIEEALRPLGVHLTPWLAGELPKALDALARAASAGPRVETKEVVRVETKTIRVADVSASNAPPVVNVLDRKTLRETFGFSKREGGAAWKHALDNVSIAHCDYFDAPAVDPHYVWSTDMAAILGLCDVSGQNAWLAGHAGTGKTEGTRQYAARTKRPFIRVPFNRTSEPIDLLGQMEPTKDGGAEWKDKALTRAFRTPHAVVLLDEPTLLRSGTLAFLQTALDTRTLHLPTGEVVECAEGVLFVACDNTMGVGDETGRYVDTSPVNAAFLDRFAYRLEVTYLSPDDEARMVSKRAGLALDAVRPMVAYAGLTREKARSGQLTMGLTPRRLIAWARGVQLGIGSAKAWDNAVINGADPTDAPTLRMLADTSLKSDHATIDAIARGVPLPTPSAAPSEVGAMFPVDEASEG